MENFNIPGVSLLDIMQIYASCSYVSDLRQLSGPQRSSVARKLSKLVPENISLREWNDALTYLQGNPPAETVAAARKRILAWLRHDQNTDTDLFDNDEPAIAAV
jgi:hypothetical protein